jgi:predicted lipoprotein with Yx(FWY)xxD motif
MRPIRISNIYVTTIVTAFVAALSASTFADSTVLTDSAGMTVYTFDKDSADRSACYGDCAAVWPPVSVSSMPTGSDFSTVSRDDGTDQAVYRGKPIYLFAGDKKAGDVNGDNVQNVWHAVQKGGVKAVARPKPDYNNGYSYGY